MLAGTSPVLEVRVQPLPDGVDAFSRALAPLDWATALLVGGSAATGDHVPGVSDLDLVVVTTQPLDASRRRAVTHLHRALDAGPARGAGLGCAYVSAPTSRDEAVAHPTWTHGRLVDRPLSGIARAELVRHGWSVFGPSPQAVLAPVTDDDVRRAARAELAGYWARAARRPWWWLDPVLVDLGLTAMARGRHARVTGRLLTKSASLDALDAPPWLADQVRARRRGEPVASPRLRSAWWAWRDAVRTTRGAGS